MTTAPGGLAPTGAPPRRSLATVLVAALCVVLGLTSAIASGLAVAAAPWLLDWSDSYLAGLEPDRPAYYQSRIRAANGRARDRVGEQLQQEIALEALCTMPLADYRRTPPLTRLATTMLVRLVLSLAVVGIGMGLLAKRRGRRGLLVVSWALVAVAGFEALLLFPDLPRLVSDFYRDLGISQLDILESVDPEGQFRLPLPRIGPPPLSALRLFAVFWFLLLSGAWQLLLLVASSLRPTSS